MPFVPETIPIARAFPHLSTQVMSDIHLGLSRPYSILLFGDSGIQSVLGHIQDIRSWAVNVDFWLIVWVKAPSQVSLLQQCEPAVVEVGL